MSSGAQLLLEPDMDIIRKKHESRDLCMDTVTDIRWQLLSGRRATEDGSLLLSAAVPIFHVCIASFHLILGIVIFHSRTLFRLFYY
jgi:hypothetical protein